VSDYPIVLTSLDDCHCIVVGGGPVAARKVRALVEAGVRPVVISPELCSELERVVASGEARVIRRPYRQDDLEGAGLVIAATDARTVNEEIANECRRRKVLINVVDCPDLCTFTAPSTIRRGDLLVTISTGGHSPAFSRFMREILEPILSETYGDMLAILSELRPRIRRRVDRSKQRALWDRLLDGKVMDRLRTQGMVAARALADRIVEDYCTPTERQVAG